MNFPDIGETALREQPVVGTIKAALRGALDGTPARVMSRTEFGYIVELLASKGAFVKGDKVYVDDGDFYHSGASIKEARHRGVIFSLIEESDVIDGLRKKFIREWSTAPYVASQEQLAEDVRLAG